MTAAVAPAAKQPSFPWWIVLIEGIATLILGVLLLTNPAQTSVVIVTALGIYWLITGILSIVRIFMNSSMWGWKLFAGIIGILAGIVIIQHPLWSAILVPTTLVFVLGIQGIIVGIVMLIEAFQGGGWGPGILGGLSILFGIFLMFNPLAGALALPLVLGIFGIVGGIAAIIMSFRLR